MSFWGASDTLFRSFCCPVLTLGKATKLFPKISTYFFKNKSSRTAFQLGCWRCFKQSARHCQNSPETKNPDRPREVRYFLFLLPKNSSPPFSQTHLSPLQLHHLQSLKNTCTSSILYKSIIQNKAFHCVEYSCHVVLSVNACFSGVCVCVCVYACVHSNHILMLFLFARL